MEVNPIKQYWVNLRTIKSYFLISIFFALVVPLATYAQLDSVHEFYGQLQKENKSQPQTIHFISEDMDLVQDYSKLSQIILLRHGEPALDKKGWRKRKEAVQFINDYDTVGIYPLAFIPVVFQPEELQVIHTSSIPRSICTAKLVFGREDLQRSDAIFREFERKILGFPNLKMGLKFWLISSRMLWFMGLNKKGIESFSEAKARARQGVLFLEQDALQNGKSLLVSHGLLNHFLKKYLKKNGWVEVFDGGKGYLSQKLLVKYDGS